MVKRVKPVCKIIKIEAETNPIEKRIFLQKSETLGVEELWVPSIDISEKEKELLIEVEVPGVSKDDISIFLNSNHVEIRGIKRDLISEDQIIYHRLEREYGGFRRIIPFPSPIDSNQSQAILENGILTLILKKLKSGKEKSFKVKIEKSKE
ncbi:MAG: Hsp20/alpha crystallin family protein [Candidatus Aminicenantaceae bacterium]